MIYADPMVAIKAAKAADALHKLEVDGDFTLLPWGYPGQEKDGEPTFMIVVKGDDAVEYRTPKYGERVRHATSDDYGKVERVSSSGADVAWDSGEVQKFFPLADLVVVKQSAESTRFLLRRTATGKFEISPAGEDAEGF
jgi:hypothetical protein